MHQDDVVAAGPQSTLSNKGPGHRLFFSTFFAWQSKKAQKISAYICPVYLFPYFHFNLRGSIRKRDLVVELRLAGIQGEMSSAWKTRVSFAKPGSSTLKVRAEGCWVSILMQGHQKAGSLSERGLGLTPGHKWNLLFLFIQMQSLTSGLHLPVSPEAAILPVGKSANTIAHPLFQALCRHQEHSNEQTRDSARRRVHTPLTHRMYKWRTC